MTRAFPDVSPGVVEKSDRTYFVSVGESFDSEDDLQFQMNVFSHGFPLWVDTLSIPVSPVDAVGEKESSLPTAWMIHDPYPNPFNSATTIQFELPNPSRVTVQVFDFLGREIVRLADTRYQAGVHRLTFQPKSLSSGMYLLRVSSPGNGEAVKKLVFMK